MKDLINKFKWYLVGIAAIGVVINLSMWLRYSIKYYDMTQMAYFWANWEIMVTSILMLIVPYSLIRLIK